MDLRIKRATAPGKLPCHIPVNKATVEKIRDSIAGLFRETPQNLRCANEFRHFKVGPNPKEYLVFALSELYGIPENEILNGEILHEGPNLIDWVSEIRMKMINYDKKQAVADLLSGIVRKVYKDHGILPTVDLDSFVKGLFGRDFTGFPPK